MSTAAKMFTESIAPASPLALNEAAERLGISRRSLERLGECGKARVIRLGGRRMLPFSEFQRLATQGTD
jgi:excisionase family DNA binding protein